jgi:hypothetical protein
VGQRGEKVRLGARGGLSLLYLSAAWGARSVVVPSRAANVGTVAEGEALAWRSPTKEFFFLVFFNYYLRNESDKSFFSFLSHVNPYDVSYEGVVPI